MMDCYKILGIEYTSDQNLIHEAFRKMALKYHPDINHDQGSDRKFKLVDKAYKILSNEKSKSTYDEKYLNEIQNKKRFVVKYKGENDKIYSSDEKDKFNFDRYDETKKAFSD